MKATKTSAQIEKAYVESQKHLQIVKGWYEAGTASKVMLRQAEKFAQKAYMEWFWIGTALDK